MGRRGPGSLSLLRIVTLNTWKNEGDYPRRLRLMVDGLTALRPDIVCLQECFVGGDLDTAATIAASLHRRHHPCAARAKPRPHEGRLVQSTSGLAILTRGCGRSEALDLPQHPDDGERVAQRLDLSVAGRSLRILNLHLTHLRGARGASLRADQLAVALDWATDGLEGALIVAGDLNATALDAELAALDIPPAPATLQPAKSSGPAYPGYAIDHCHLLHAGGWRALRQGVAMDDPDEDGWRPSDHKAVVLDLEPV